MDEGVFTLGSLMNLSHSPLCFFCNNFKGSTIDYYFLFIWRLTSQVGFHLAAERSRLAQERQLEVGWFG